MTSIEDGKKRIEESKIASETNTLISALPEFVISFLTKFERYRIPQFQATDPINVVRDGWSPLLLACFEAEYGVANSVLDLPDEQQFNLVNPVIGGVVDEQHSALSWCFKKVEKSNTFYKVVQKLIQRGNPDFRGSNFIFQAYGNIPLLKILLNARYDINQPDERALYTTVSTDMAFAGAVSEMGLSVNALSTQLLIISGARLDLLVQYQGENRTILETAEVSLVLDERHERDALDENEGYPQTEEERQSALNNIYRRRQGFIAMIQFLRSVGNIKGNHNLFRIVQTNDCRQAESLLNLLTGFDPFRHYEDNILLCQSGNTLLHQACLGNRPKMIRFLLDRGFLLTEQNDKGHTPLDLAVLHHNKASIFLLMNIIQMQINHGVFGVKRGFRDPSLQRLIPLDIIPNVLSWLWSKTPRMVDSSSGPVFATTTQAKGLIQRAFDKANNSREIQTAAQRRTLEIRNNKDIEIKSGEEEIRLRHAVKSLDDFEELSEQFSQAQILESLQVQFVKNRASSSELKRTDETTRQLENPSHDRTAVKMPLRPASELRLTWLNRNFPIRQNSSSSSNAQSQSRDISSSFSSSSSSLSSPSSRLSLSSLSSASGTATSVAHASASDSVAAVSLKEEADSSTSHDSFESSPAMLSHYSAKKATQANQKQQAQQDWLVHGSRGHKPPEWYANSNLLRKNKKR